MSFPRHSKYKNSGVEWLGSVPEHWDVIRVSRLFKEVAEPGTEDLPILSVSIHDGVSDEELGPDELERKFARSDDRSKYKRVEPGDLVYNMMRAWQGGFGSVRVAGMVSPAYVVARPKLRLSTAFVEHLLRTPAAIEEMRRHSYGVTDFRLRLYWDQFKDLYLTLPSPDEQTAIIAFLDREIAKIDSLVEEQQRLIKLLKEKRQTAISRAVTQGVNPNVLMKNSGVEWLREVPAHWEVAALKWFVDFLDGRRVPLSSEERSQRQGEFPYYGASGIIDHIDDFLFDEPLILVGEDGANLIYRSTPLAFIATGQYWVNNHAHVLKPHDGELSFWSERIEAIDFIPFVSGSAQPKLTIQALASVHVAVPHDVAERRAIAEHVSAIQAKTAPLIAEAEKAIFLLKERRSALIFAAVTGKIDVRGLVETNASSQNVAAA